jgi:uncharacterized protein (TIGR02300 family)
VPDTAADFFCRWEVFLFLTGDDEHGNWHTRNEPLPQGGRRVAKPEWGKKRTCQSCGAAFYDLKRKTISCPKCGTPYNSEPQGKGKRVAAIAPVPIAAAPPKPKPVPVRAAQAAASDDDLETFDDEEEELADDDRPSAELAGKAKIGAKGDDKDEALIEDASDLGEDDDDIGEVKEHIDDGVGDKA